MKLIYCLLVFGAILFISCDNSTSPDGDYAKLEQIYKDNSPTQFESYLSEWNKESVPVPGREIKLLSVPARSIYEIFQEFYDPFNLNKYSGEQSRYPEIGNNYNSGVKYIVIQNKIEYTFNDEYEKRDSLTDFRPDISFPAAKRLYFRGKQKNEIIEFLNTDNHREDIRQRFDFLNSKLRVSPGHWFGWHYITHPEIHRVNFNSSLDTAVVHFRIRFEGGESVFVRTNNTWKMISSKLTWIE